MKKDRKNTWALGLVLVIFLTTMVFAQTSKETINLQGRLTDSAGSTVTDGNYTFKIRLYDSATLGNLLYSEQQTVTVAKGIYNVLLGTGTVPVAGDSPSYTALKNMFANTDDVWMGISVGTDAEMTPRSKITASGYAMKSIDTEKINGLAEAELLGPAFKSGSELAYVDANTLSVSAGSMVINGIYRRNTSAVTITWTGLDTGAEANAKDYFVYAVADAPSDKTFTVKISISNPNWHPSGYYNSGAGSPPTGVTNYRLLGYFHNSLGGNIIQNSVVINENLNGNTLAAGIPLPGMVRVGNFAVDIYESSIFSGVTQYGIASDDYPAGLPDTGNQATGFYAVSRGDIRPSATVAGGDVMPSAIMTWFQAVQCAANSGKRLITNIEWQTAVVGKLNYVYITHPYSEMGWEPEAAPAYTRPNYVNRWNCYEMAGNVWEWAAEWSTVPGWNGDVCTHDTPYGNDGYWHGGLTDANNPTSNNNDSSRPFSPAMAGNGDTAGEECGYAAFLRGGTWSINCFSLKVSNAPSGWFIAPCLGFRCAR